MRLSASVHKIADSIFWCFSPPRIYHLWNAVHNKIQNTTYFTEVGLEFREVGLEFREVDFEFLKSTSSSLKLPSSFSSRFGVSQVGF